MNYTRVRFLFAAVVVAVGGCGTVEESQEAPPPSPPVVQQPPKMGFETRTDTVYSRKSRVSTPSGVTGRERQIRFMVQIGAFKDAQNASRIQTLARQRYHLPVLNDYHPTLALYQIRIGFFETREAAYAFRQRMHKEFPADYKGAWVVQLKR